MTVGGGSSEHDPHSFWKTLPGVLSAVGGLLVGIAAIVAAIVTINRNSPASVPPFPTSPFASVAQTSRPPTFSGAGGPTEGDLFNARLAASDLPSGWVDTFVADTELWPCNESPQPARSATSTGVAFQVAENGLANEFAYTRLDSYRTESDAIAALNSLHSNAARCASSAFSKSGASFEFIPFTGPPFGDGNPVHMLLKQGAYSFSLDQDTLVSFIRWGRTLLEVDFSTFGSHGSHSATDYAGQQDIIKRALTKVQTLRK